MLAVRTYSGMFTHYYHTYTGFLLKDMESHRGEGHTSHLPGLGKGSESAGTGCPEFLALCCLVLVTSSFSKTEGDEITDYYPITSF